MTKFMNKMTVVDSHCHLNYQGLVENLDNVITAARNQNVLILNTIATSIEEIEENIKICEKYEGVFCSVGIHPTNVKAHYSNGRNDRRTRAVSEHDLYDTLIAATKHKKVIGVGETGLDYGLFASEKTLNEGITEEEKMHEIEEQKSSFITHISVSQKTKIPVVIHSRYAESDMIAVLSKCMTQAEFTGVMHCFTGSLELARSCLDLGLYISASGIITFKNASDLRNIFRQIPLNRILIETDAPFLSPVPHRNIKTNQPAHVVEIVKCLSDIHGLSYEKMAEITTKNFFSVFSKAYL